SVHQELATVIAHQLGPKLRPKYIAFPERKYIRGSSEDVFITPSAVVPDVSVRRARQGTLKSPTQVLSAPVRLRSRVSVSVPPFRIIIRDVLRRRLVTAIE